MVRDVSCRFELCMDHNDAVSRAQCCQTALEELVLVLLRLTCAGFRTESVTYWELAYEQAEAHLGPIDGPPFVARLSALVRALSNERPASFSFMPVSCGLASADECALIKAVRSGLDADAAKVIRAAVDLAKTRNCPHTALATHAFAAAVRRQMQMGSGSASKH
jgi:hypothetical protein